MWVQQASEAVICYNCPIEVKMESEEEPCGCVWWECPECGDYRIDRTHCPQSFYLDVIVEEVKQ